MVVSLLMMAACDDADGDGGIDAQQLQLEKLKGTWSSQAVTLDGFDITGFENFTLTIGDKTYQSTNGQGVWADSGTWDFKGTSIATIVRDDDVEISVNLVNDSEMILSFQFIDPNAGGRHSGIGGSFQFSISK